MVRGTLLRAVVIGGWRTLPHQPSERLVFAGAASLPFFEGCGFRRYSVNQRGEFGSPSFFANQCWFRDACLHAHKCVFLG